MSELYRVQVPHYNPVPLTTEQLAMVEYDLKRMENIFEQVPELDRVLRRLRHYGVDITITVKDDNKYVEDKLNGR